MKSCHSFLGLNYIIEFVFKLALICLPILFCHSLNGQSPPDCPNMQLDEDNIIFDGFLNTALGEATLSLSPDGGTLTVSNIGSSGLDGVRQDVPDSWDMVTGLATPNFSLSGPGARLEGVQIGIVDGQPNQLFSKLIVENTGGQLEINGDWSFIGNTSYRIDVFTHFQGELIGSFPGLSSGLIIIPGLMNIDTVDCKIQPPCELTFSCTPGPDDPIPNPTAIIPEIGVVEGGTYYKIIAENPINTPTAQTQILMFGQNLGGSFGIVSESTQPPPSVCPSINPIPTLSEWGIILFTLLLLSFGIIFIRRSQRQLALVGATEDYYKMSWFQADSFKGFPLTLLLAIVLISVIIFLTYGLVTTIDLGGIVISALIVAYLWHFLKME